MEAKKDKEKARRIRKFRIRKKIMGTPESPRLSVFKSLRHTYAQAVDDLNGRTIASACTLDKECKDQIKNGGNVEAAKLIGALIAKRLKEKGITRVVFDRGGYLYHGRVKALAKSAREHGLKF